MIKGTELRLERCPCCGVATPLISRQGAISTSTSRGKNRQWQIFGCRSCGGALLAEVQGEKAVSLVPEPSEVDAVVPERPREYLSQALGSLGQPAGAIMLAASAVDAMLKVKGLTEGSLYARIDQAAKQHLITADMAKWAHQVRLDANDQRHADLATSLPTEEEARLTVRFADALAEFLFVIPARVTRGLEEAKGQQ